MVYFKDKMLMISFALHFMVGTGFYLLSATDKKPENKVRILVVKSEPKKKKPSQSEVKKKQAKPKKKPKKPKKKLVTRKAKAPAKKKERVLGLTKKSLSDKGPAVAAPIGNTVNELDKGIRLSKDDTPTETDLSRDAQLIKSTLKKPAYTDEALDANLEGNYTVSVFVDQNGNVLDAELEDSIGYGMDSRVIEAAKKARFSPRLNKTGQAIEGWTEIVFFLRIF